MRSVVKSIAAMKARYMMRSLIAMRRLIGSMISHGHLPRPNALTAVERALGDDLQHHLDLGSTLSVSQSAQLALESLDALLDRSVTG